MSPSAGGTSPSIVVVGLFPPPVGGAAKNNALLASALEREGARVVRVNLAAPTMSHARTLAYHLHRAVKNIRGWHRIRAEASRGAVVYCVPDGGMGIWYTYAHLRTAAKFSARIVIHHRTHLYVESDSRPMRSLVEATAGRATHVFLTDGMRDRFAARYGDVEGIVATNAQYVVNDMLLEPEHRPPELPAQLGYLSNLCEDKGFSAVVETFEAAREAGIAVHLHVAGPVVERSAGQQLDHLLATYTDAVTYHGPLDGEAKRDFYRSLDVFLFPTRFKLEAAPNVLYEAMAAGVPVITTDRGCIPDMVDAVRGAVIARGDSFASRAVTLLRAWPMRGDAALRRRSAIVASVRTESAESVTAHQRLLRLLLAR